MRPTPRYAGLVERNGFGARPVRASHEDSTREEGAWFTWPRELAVRSATGRESDVEPDDTPAGPRRRRGGAAEIGEEGAGRTRSR